MSGSAFTLVCAPSQAPDVVDATACHAPLSIRSFTLPSAPSTTEQTAPKRTSRSFRSSPLRSATARMSPLCGTMAGRVYGTTSSVYSACV